MSREREARDTPARRVGGTAYRGPVCLAFSMEIHQGGWISRTAVRGPFRLLSEHAL